ncbi:hypothetical protein AYL99_05980 [Fonsecaea erecta]|uniref:Cytochrome P450 n=1 Tax=Fonsecaea erecta TaxID=1367422 RepID=A0A178ZNM0_9EURO|nr:hypothetical protein AYL99_05980 [Fonsecaea erecta]OAP60976.1 hypothetical protein AYL99_05980 [Fonsecaea erecta]
MIFLLLVPGCLAVLLLFLVVEHVAIYLWDSKGLRRYHNLNFLCGITNLGYIIHLWRGDAFRTRELMAAHRQHKVVRLGPNALSFADLRAIRDIYGHGTLCSKGDMYSTPAGEHRSILDSVDKQEHAAKRRRLAAAFATKHLEAWEWKIVDKCERLVAQLDRFCVPSLEKSNADTTVVDLRKWTNLFTVEAIADIALSEHLGMLEAGHDKVLALEKNGMTREVSFIASLHGLGRSIAPIVWSSRAYGLLKRVVPLFSRKFQQEQDNNTSYDAIVRRLVQNRLRRQIEGEELDDFFASLWHDKQGNATNLPVGEIEAEVSVFMNAGSDTTAIALTHVLYYLLKNPDKLEKLRKELDHYLIQREAIAPSYGAVKDLPYLRACLDESLRLSPPVAFGLERKTPAEGTTVAGQWIAGDTLVSVPAYVAHRDPVAFPEPEKFVPERWLADEAKEIQKYFISFSAGARGCIGRNITYMEQFMLVATLMRRYDFALPHRDWELTWEERFNLWPRALPLRISQPGFSSQRQEPSSLYSESLNVSRDNTAADTRGNSLACNPAPWGTTALDEILLPASDKLKFVSAKQTELPVPSAGLPLLAASITPRTAFLLRTYETGIATWMDVFDCSLSYQQGLLQLVPQSPLLLNSTCALAARQLSLITDPQTWTPVAEQHYGESLSMLRSTLEKASMNAEHALVATILLSSYELLAFPGLNYHRHFRGAKSFVEALEAYKSPKRMTRASFWIYARHEVGQALNLERPPMLDPTRWPKQDLLHTENVGEDVYCNDALRLCAEVIHLIFGSQPLRRGKKWVNQWSCLHEEWESWIQEAPKILLGQEYLDRASRRRYWFPRSCFASALCFYHVCQVFLLTHRPQALPTTSRQTSGVVLEQQIQQHAQTVIDVALSDMPDGVQVVMMQPVFHAAKHVQDVTRRNEAIILLTDIQRRTGFHTEFKVDILKAIPSSS